MAKLIDHFPAPLLTDLVAGRWLPIVGAGFSRNARTGGAERVPLWDELGRALAEDLREYPYTGPVDAASAYAHEFSRPKLIERLCDLLLIDKATPGIAHKAFCGIPFSTVCTTNFDFLLERQYDAQGRYCRPIVGEDQLTIRGREGGTQLLKVHGDLHHPERLVVSESDYDCFLDRYPLLATHLSSLLIGNTPVLIGYSLDDPDFRHIWSVVNDRLGKSRSQGYAIAVSANSSEVSRFDRRGIKVINLPGSRKEYGEVLAAAFTELGEYLRSNILPASIVLEEEVLRELSLPPESPSRMAFFAVPVRSLSFYREYVFPIAERYGFVPLAADEVVAPGENFLAKIDALMDRASVVIVDLSSNWGMLELSQALKSKGAAHVLPVIEPGQQLPGIPEKLTFFIRPDPTDPEAGEFLWRVAEWFRSAFGELEQAFGEEARRLLNRREYRAAVAFAIALLESELRRALEDAMPSRKRSTGLRSLLDYAGEVGVITSNRIEKVQEWVALRNQVVHSAKLVRKGKAAEVVQGVEEILAEIRP